MIQKKENWRSQLFAWIHENRKGEFSRGSCDCVRKVGDCTKAFTGTDVSIPWRELYATDQEAKDLLEKEGGMKAILIDHFKKLGCLEIPVREMLVGDLAFYPLDAYGSLGVCVGETCFIQGKTRLVYLPMLKAKMAWRISE